MFYISFFYTKSLKLDVHFYTYKAPQSRLATFQLPESNMWLVGNILDSKGLGFYFTELK